MASPMGFDKEGEARRRARAKRVQPTEREQSHFLQAAKNDQSKKEKA